MIQTLKTDQPLVQELLDTLDIAQADFERLDQRESVREKFRRKCSARIWQPGGTDATYEIVVRNLSRGGLSFVHGGFLYPGTRCEISINTLRGDWQNIRGSVAHCRLVGGRIHEMGVKFNSSIRISDFVADRLTGRILLVDDAPEFAALTRHHLQRRGLLVAVAPDGESAYERLTKEPFDIAIIDLELPGIDSLTLIGALRQCGMHIPVVAVSANQDPTLATSSRAAGADEFLQKPMQPKKLAATLASYLRFNDVVVSDFSADADMMPFITEFTSRLPTRMYALREVIYQRDLEESLRQIRDLRVTASTDGGCGFSQLSELAEQIEFFLTDAPDWDKVDYHAMELTALCKHVEGAPSTPQTSTITVPDHE
jgi:CheY-like chemotaxis protein